MTDDAALSEAGFTLFFRKSVMVARQVDTCPVATTEARGPDFHEVRRGSDLVVSGVTLGRIALLPLSRKARL